MPGPATVPYSASSTWQACPKTAIISYRSIWNKTANTLHVLPHWTWPGREGENTPVFVYTSYPLELFVNGKSYGKQRKLTASESKALQGKDSLALQRRYRLMWMDVPYEPGELKVVAYDASGKPAEEKIVVPPANLIIWNWLPTAPGLLPTVKTLPTSPSALSIKTAISVRRTIVLFLSL